MLKPKQLSRTHNRSVIKSLVTELVTNISILGRGRILLSSPSHPSYLMWGPKIVATKGTGISCTQIEASDTSNQYTVRSNVFLRCVVWTSLSSFLCLCPSVSHSRFRQIYIKFSTDIPNKNSLTSVSVVQIDFVTVVLHLQVSKLFPLVVSTFCNRSG